MSQSEDYTKMEESVRNSVYGDLVEMTKKKEEELEEKHKENLMMLSITISKFETPILWKIHRIKQRRKDFEPKRIVLSLMADAQLKELHDKGILRKGECVGLPYRVSNRIPNEVFCKIEGE